jgi:hypothetical protein
MSTGDSEAVDWQTGTKYFSFVLRLLLQLFSSDTSDYLCDSFLYDSL